MKFITTFFSSFTLISILTIIISGSIEMLAYFLWFQLSYIVMGSVGWLAINSLMKPSSKLLLIGRFVSGLVVLNLLVYTQSEELPSLTLIGLGGKFDNFWVSLIMHLVYAASFIIATATSIKPLVSPKNKS